MPWCPKCKNEYVEGITTCADCGCKLVQTLTDEEEALLFGEQEQMQRLLDFLNYNGITSARLQEDEAEHVYEIFTAKGDLERAKQAAAVFLREDAQSKAGQEEDTEAEPDEAASAQQDKTPAKGSTGAYKDSAQKAAEFKDSGYTLIGVGIVGLIVMILVAVGVIPFRIGGSMAWLTYGVMGGMFLIFIVIGTRSMVSAKRYKKEALTESNLKDEIMSWCREALRADELDAQLSQTELSEEEKYFKRTELIKKQISGKFLNIDEGFLDHLIDEFYSELFE